MISGTRIDRGSTRRVRTAVLAALALGMVVAGRVDGSSVDQADSVSTVGLQPAVVGSPDVPTTSENQTPTRITHENISFVYESRVSTPEPDEWFMRLISADYRSASDEFTRRRLADQLQPVIDRRLREARAVSRISVEVTYALGEYDFERSAFPTSAISEYVTNYDRANWSSSVSRKGYSLEFTNAEDFAFVPVAEDFAQELITGEMRDSRRVELIVTGTIVRAAVVVERSNGYIPLNTLFVRAEQVDVTLQSGTIVRTLEL